MVCVGCETSDVIIITSRTSVSGGKDSGVLYGGGCIVDVYVVIDLVDVWRLCCKKRLVSENCRSTVLLLVCSDFCQCVMNYDVCVRVCGGGDVDGGDCDAVAKVCLGILAHLARGWHLDLPCRASVQNTLLCRLYDCRATTVHQYRVESI